MVIWQQIRKQMVMSDYHIPIMLEECIDGLDIKSDGLYVDATFGGGGHSKGIAGKNGGW